MNEIPYINLMMMNATMPTYGGGSGGSSGGGGSSNRPMNMFEIAARVEKGLGV